MNVDYVTLSNLIIDDIVLPEGKTYMNTLGGAGLHALVGMRVWNDALGYAAVAGADLGAEHRQALARFGVDLKGLLIRSDYLTARAWQVFELDERRIEVFRTDFDEFERQKITLSELPGAYRKARGFHLQWGSLSELENVVNSLHATNPDMVFVLEVSPDHLDQPAAAFRSLLPQVTAFAPDLKEAEMITARSDPADMCRVLLDWGVPIVALRMGERGSLLFNNSDDGCFLPAAPATIVDVTGAGNSYCGGLLTGLGDGLSVLESGLRAVVSASFALEQFGLPAWAAPPEAEALRRLAWARNRVERADGQWRA